MYISLKVANSISNDVTNHFLIQNRIVVLIVGLLHIVLLYSLPHHPPNSQYIMYKDYNFYVSLIQCKNMNNDNVRKTSLVKLNWVFINQLKRCDFLAWPHQKLPHNVASSMLWLASYRSETIMQQSYMVASLNTYVVWSCMSYLNLHPPLYFIVGLNIQKRSYRSSSLHSPAKR